MSVPEDTPRTPGQPEQVPIELPEALNLPGEQAAPGSDLKRRTVSAIKWSYFSMVTGIALQLVFAAVLSRLLTKDQFGIVANAFILQRFGQFIADLGVGQAIVQKRELSEKDVSAALTSSLVLGGLATLLIWLAAPAAGRYFGSPELVGIVRGYSSIYVLTGSIIVSSSLLRRELRFRPLVIAELSSYFIGHGLLGLGAAYLGYGASSLVISAVAQAVIQLVILYAFSRHRLALTLRPADYRQLFSFGTRATAVNFLEFLSSSLDTWMIAKLFGQAALGLYSRTYSTLAAPAMNFAMSLTRVLAPSFSAIQGDLPRLSRTYLTGLQTLSLIIFSAAGCIFVDAHEIVAVMLGPRFIEAVTLMQTFALFIPFAVLTNLSAVLAEATAHLNVKVRIQAVYLVALFVAFWLTYRLGGHIEAFAAVLVAATALRSLAFAVVARFILGGQGRVIARAYLSGLLSGLGAAALTLALIAPLRWLGAATPVLFVTEVLAGALVVLGVILRGPPNDLQQMVRRTLEQLYRRGRAAVRPN